MKQVTALPAPALSYKLRVKKLLIKGVIHLSSEKFFIFATIIAGIVCWIGACIDSAYTIAYGAIVWLSAYTPWMCRQTARDRRHYRLGLKN